jgi:hypothetical protein
MEIGGPMASLYLLGNPDHYTGHKFVTVYWKSYVTEVLNAWKDTDDAEVSSKEKITVHKNKNKYVGVSPVFDYMHRPKRFNDKTLYEWIQMAKRVKKKIKVDDNFDINDSLDELDLLNSDQKDEESIERLGKLLKLTMPLMMI